MKLNRRNLFLASSATITLTFSLTAPSAHAANGTWDGGGSSGIWGGTGNWVSALADGADSIATFHNTYGTYANPYNIVVNTTRTIGNINFTGTLYDITISRNTTTSSFTLDVTSGSPTITVATANRTLTISTPILGNDGLTKAGAGTLIFNPTANNTYTGNTTISAGKLSLSGGNNNLSDTDAVNLSGATGIFDISAITTSETIGLLTGVAGSQVVLGGKTLVVGNATSSTFAGNISGALGRLTKQGAGTLTLSGNNTYTGNTTISAGALSVGAANNLGAAAANLVFDGGTLQVTGTALTSLTSLGRTNPVVFTAAKTVGFDIADANNSFTVGQVLNQTTGGLTKLGAGTLILDQTNTYTGNTTISVGKLSLSGGNNTLADTGAVNLDNAAGTFDISAITTSETIGLLTGVAGSNVVLGSKNLTVGNTTSSAFAGVISGANGTLTKAGSGTLTLSGNNTYTGGTAINAGKILASNNNALGSGNVTMGGSSSGLQLQLSNGVNISNAITLNGGSTSGQGIIHGMDGTSANATYSGDITITAGALNGGGHFGANGTLNLNGNITSSGNTTEVLFRNGTIVLNGTGNSFSAMNIQGATVRLGVNNALANGTSVQIGTSENSILDLNGFNQSLGNITGANVTRATIASSSTTANSTLTITGTSTYAGKIVDTTGSGNKTVALDVNSSGTFTLAGNNTYTGLTTISGGTLQIGNGSTSGSIANTTGVTNNASLIYNRSNDLGAGYAISGNGSVTKLGAGTLTLTANNTYSGATLVSAGTLALTGSGTVNGSGNITINGSGAKFLQNSSVAGTSPIFLTQGTLTGNGTVGAVSVDNTVNAILSNNNGVAGGTLTTGALTFNGNATVNLFSDGVSTSALIAAGTLSSNAAGNVTINASAASWTNGTAYDLISYTGGNITGAGFGQFSLGTVLGTTARQSGNLTDSGTAITLAISGDRPYWTGNVTNKWNTNGDPNTGVQNWKLETAGTPTAFLSTDDVLFDDNADNSGTVTVDIDGASVLPFATTFDNNTRDYVINGNGTNGIANGTLLVKGGGNVTLNTVNTYTGLTTVSSGNLTLVNGLASGNALTLGANGTADFQNAGQTLGAVSNANTATNALNFSAGNGTVTLASLTGAGNTRFGSDGVVTGGISSGTVTSVGNLTANISGGAVTAGGLLTGTISGIGTVNAGSLSSTSITGGTNTITGAATITTLDGGNTTVGGVATITTLTSGTANLNGATSAITTLNGGTINLGTTALTVSGGTSAGTITGANGSLIKAGSGTLTLSGNNSYGGGTTINVGKILASNSNALGSGNVTMGGSSIGLQLRLSEGVNLSNAITMNGGSTSAEGVIYAVGNATYSGDVTINADPLNGGGHFASASGKTLTLNGNITSASAPVWFRDGTVILNGTGSSYAQMNIQGGTVRLGANNVIPVGATAQIGINGASTLDLAGFNQSLVGITRGNMSQSATIGSSSTTANSTLTLTGTSSYAGTIVDSVSGGNKTVGLTVASGGNLTLTNANTFTGGTLVSGNLVLGNATNTLADTGAINVSGGTLDLGANADTVGVVTLTSGSITSSTGVLTGTGGNFSVLSGNVSARLGGSVGLDKSTAGTVILTGANTFTGNITVDDGKLSGRVGGFGASSTARTITVANGAILEFGAGNVFGNHVNTNVPTIVVNGGTVTNTDLDIIDPLVKVNNALANITLNSGTLTATTGNVDSVFPRVGESYGTWGLNGTVTSTGNSSIDTTAVASPAGHVLLSSTGTATVFDVANGTLTVASVLQRGDNATDTGFTKTGVGTLALTNANIFTGGVTINAGQLLLGNAGALNSTAGSENAVTFGASSTGTLTLAGNSVVIRSLTSNATPGTPVVENANAGNATLTIGNSLNLASSFAGVIQDGTGGGALSLSKAGTNTLTLGGTNTYTGVTDISAGTVILANATALGTTPGVNGTSAISMAAGTALQSNVSGVTIAAPLTLSGSGNITFIAGVAAGSTTNLNGAIGGTTGNVVFTTTTNSFSNAVSTFVLGAAGNYTGNTLITTGNGGNNPVVVRSGVVNALPTTTVLSFDGVAGTASGRTFQYDLNGNDQELAGLTNTMANSRNQRVNNSGNLATLTINNTADMSFGGAFATASGGNITRAQLNGNISLTKNGTGTFTLGGTLLGNVTAQGNTHTGDTKILGGTLVLGESLSLQNSAFDTAGSIAGNSTAGLRSSVATLTLGGLKGDKNFADVFETASGNYTSLTALTLNPGANVTHSYSADIGDGAGGMSLAKTGAGTQVLSGNNTYTGTTTLTTGTLSVGFIGNIGEASNLGNGTATNLAFTGGTLQYTGANATTDRGFTNTATGTIENAAGSNIEFSGNSSITGALTKTGTGTLTLSGSNTYANATVNDGTLEVSGGGTFVSNRIWNGNGTLAITGGTLTGNNQRFNVATINHTGGNVTMGGSAGSGTWINYAAGRSVDYTVSGTGTYNLNGTSGAYLGLGRDAGDFNSTLTVQSGGTVNIGTTGDGSLWLSQTNTGNNTARLDIQGGDLTIGTGNATGNALRFFNGGGSGNRSAIMTQSGGNATINGIEFGSTSGTYDATANATLQLSGGNLFVGANGITKGSGAGNLTNINIQLLGGTLGADQNWSSSLDMKLGTATIQAASANGTARDITLSGSLSNDSGNGTLTKTGAGTLTLSGNNSYTGTTTVTQGALVINGAVASTSVVVDGSLQGSGVAASATFSGSGSIDPGNSPGILTGAATDPTSGLDFNFEFAAGPNTLPTWSNASASGNDVLRLTDGTSPFTAALGGTNTVTIYFGVTSLNLSDVFTGGFYTDLNVDFLSSISSGVFQYFLADVSGTTSYMGGNYTQYTGPYTINVSTFQVANADFAGGNVTGGYVSQFTVVPEPRAALLGGLGLLALLRRRRN